MWLIRTLVDCKIIIIIIIIQKKYRKLMKEQQHPFIPESALIG